MLVQVPALHPKSYPVGFTWVFLLLPVWPRTVAELIFFPSHLSHHLKMFCNKELFLSKYPKQNHTHTHTHTHTHSLIQLNTRIDTTELVHQSLFLQFLLQKSMSTDVSLALGLNLTCYLIPRLPSLCLVPGLLRITNLWDTLLLTECLEGTSHLADSWLEIVVLLVGKIPWKRQPTPVFLLGEFHGERSLVGYSA